MQKQQEFDLTHYKINKLLGRNIHDVIEVENTQSNKIMALKKIPSTTIEGHLSTLNEIDLLFKCRHPNIVQIYGYNESIETTQDSAKPLYITNVFMEKLDESFLSILEKNKTNPQLFTKEELLNLIDSVLSGFWYLELKEKPHGDFRPGNLMVKHSAKTQKSMFKIIDVIGAQKLYLISNTKQLSENKNLEYVAPEILEAIRQEKFNCFINFHKADVFSVGLVFLNAALMEVQFNEQLNQGTNVSKKKLEKKLAVVEKNYGVEIKLLIESMLDSNNKTRPSFEELAAKRKLVFKQSYEKDEEN